MKLKLRHYAQLYFIYTIIPQRKYLDYFPSIEVPQT